MKTAAWFLGVAAAVTAALFAFGCAVLPLRYGQQAAASVYWASGVAFLGSVVGVLPLLIGGRLSPKEDGPGAATRFLASMLARLLAVGVAAVAAVLLGGVEMEPFFLWLALSYLVLLVVDTWFALRVSRSL